MTPLLRVKNLKVSFSSLGIISPAVRGVSFDLNVGECIALIGESGSGKSVSAKAILRLLPPSSSIIEDGEVLFEGKDLLGLSEQSMRRYRGGEIAMIFQDPISCLDPTMKIGNQILETYRRHHRSASKNEAKSRVLELLELVKIPNVKQRYDQYPYELSGGICQRVMIAMAISSNPKILIADEPTTSLDVTIQAQILDLLTDLQKKLGMSILFISHDLSLVAKFCSRVLVMYAGKIVESAPVEKLYYHPSHPYTKRLLDTIPKIDDNLPLRPIEGTAPNLRLLPDGCSFSPRCHLSKDICNKQSPPYCSIAEETHVACWLHSEEK